MILHNTNIFINLAKLILNVKDVKEEKKTIFFQNKTTFLYK
jgi:hypothetical protein